MKNKEGPYFKGNNKNEITNPHCVFSIVDECRKDENEIMLGFLNFAYTLHNVFLLPFFFQIKNEFYISGC